MLFRSTETTVIGPETGRRIRQKIRKKPAPSIIAASASSPGRVWKKPLSTNTVKLSEYATYTSTSYRNSLQSAIDQARAAATNTGATA